MRKGCHLRTRRTHISEGGSCNCNKTVQRWPTRALGCMQLQSSSAVLAI